MFHHKHLHPSQHSATQNANMLALMLIKTALLQMWQLYEADSSKPFMPIFRFLWKKLNTTDSHK